MTPWEVQAVTGCVSLPTPFAGVHQVLPFTNVHYELCGNAQRGVVCALGGISADRHVTTNDIDDRAGWWSAQAGPNRAIDTSEFAVLGIDYLGAHLQRGDAVPQVSTLDQAYALVAVLDHLGIEQLSALVGASYGGMVALAFATLFPDRVQQVVVIGAAHEPHPMATAIRSVQRKIVHLALNRGVPNEGLSLARQLAMTTYRTVEEFAERFNAEQPVENYLEHCGSRYVESFTPERFLCLSRSIDGHCICPADVRVTTTLVAIEGDGIAPPWQIRTLAREIGEHATLIQIRSRYGHDAFLKEVDAISDVLRQSIHAEVTL